MPPKIVVANWKMHKDLGEGIELVHQIIQMLHDTANDLAQVVLLPPFIHLDAIGKLIPTPGSIYLGAQNCHAHTWGAFTGEVSASMLQSVGASFVLIGHSERRQYFGESNALLAQKVSTALIHGLRPIFCCGESKWTRVAGHQESFVNKQLTASLFHLSAAQIAQITIAYEPIWAIGTGSTPAPSQVQAIHRSIRNTIAHKYGEEIAQSISILYGGSCNVRNARDFFACADVDGGLIGKASLEAASFVSIVNALK